MENQEQKPIEENEIGTKIKLPFIFGLLLVFEDTTPEISRNEMAEAQHSIVV